MAFLTIVKQTLFTVTISIRLLFHASNTRHQRLPSDPPPTADQSSLEAPFQQPEPTISPATMPSFPSPLLTSVIVRTLQLLCAVGWVGCVELADTHTGRWSFNSVKATVLMGAIGSTITCIMFFLYVVTHQQLLGHTNRHGHAKRLLLLIIAVSIDAVAGCLWIMACVAALLPKRNDYRHLFIQPPRTEWYAGAVFAFIECCLFVGSIIMLLLVYRMNPIRAHDRGIQLTTRTNIGNTAFRATDIPSTGLSRTG
ncbi:MAG: hypothetical protein Q9208_008355 [Pyrenodesmia sp. 3 TL-2023]